MRQTLAGAAVSAEWLDVSHEQDERPRRVHAPRLYPRQQWEATAGLEVLPVCHNCGSLMCWVGLWRCTGCALRGGLLVDGTSTPSRLPREALAGVPIFSPSEGNNSTRRQEWLWAVESLTSMHRRSVAAQLRARGTRLAESVDDDGVCASEPYISKWHQQRIDGQAERFERVAACGTYEYALDVTDEHGNVTTRPLRKKCDCWRVCPRCMNKRKWKLSEGMKSARARALQIHRSQLHKRYRGKEGKWSEKLITFTVPHGEGGPAADARVLVGAWQKLLRRIRRHLVQRGAYEVRGARAKRTAVSVPWNRALEVATSNGEHAHMHVWWLGPFLDVSLLSLWWGELLTGAGVAHVQRVPTTVLLGRGKDARLAGWAGNPEPDELLPCGIVDIRTDKGGDGGLAAYAQKVGISLYVTKGTETSALEPAHAASIYEVFEGTRAVQWARGWAPPKVPLKARCVSFRRLTEEEKKALNRSGVTPIKGSTNAEENTKNSGESAVELAMRARPATAVVPAVSVRQVVRMAQLAFDKKNW